MSRILLMQSILGHMTLLAEKYPQKAASPVARRAKRTVKQSLRTAAAATTAQVTTMKLPVAHKTLRRAA